ncbi:MAG: hypothetical protein WEB88_17485 [Gemmatimonadota bacterium]
MLSALLTLLAISLVVVLVAGVVLAVVGAAVGLVFTLLFKVAPLVLVGWLVVRFLAPRQKRLSPADREWLES